MVISVLDLTREDLTGYIHVVASPIRDQVEDLAKLQGVGAVVNLCVCMNFRDVTERERKKERTINKPVTLTIRLAVLGEDGCASKVVTLCCTFAKGSSWTVK